MTWESVTNFAQRLESFWTAIGLALTASALLYDHAWRRKHYAMEMAHEWNTSTAKHRRVITTKYPTLLDKKHDEPPEIDYGTAILIRRREHKLNDHIIQHLNYCEYVALSHLETVARRRIIARSFVPSLIRWHNALSEYIVVTIDARGYNPWQALCDFAHEKYSEEAREHRTEPLKSGHAEKGTFLA